MLSKFISRLVLMCGLLVGLSIAGCCKCEKADKCGCKQKAEPTKKCIDCHKQKADLQEKYRDAELLPMPQLEEEWPMYVSHESSRPRLFHRMFRARSRGRGC